MYQLSTVFLDTYKYFPQDCVRICILGTSETSSVNCKFIVSLGMGHRVSVNKVPPSLSDSRVLD